MNERESKSRKEGAWLRSLRYSSVGLEMGLAVAVGYWVGDWLDERFGTAPCLLIVFLLLGVASGMLNLYRAARRAMEEQRSDD